MHIISGKYKGRRLEAPAGAATRPTSGGLREALFNICQTTIEGADFLDLCAGSGAMGLEALSRGAKSATLVDNSREALLAIQKNIELLNVSGQAAALYGDLFTVLGRLAKQGKHYSIIYSDPPYTIDNYNNRLLELIDQTELLLPRGYLFIEEPSKAPEYEGVLATLSLKSSRRMGRSVLKQYIKT
jgi:16S rRNA (guanine966-N2)-methyltransferase